MAQNPDEEDMSRKFGCREKERSERESVRDERIAGVVSEREAEGGKESANIPLRVRNRTASCSLPVDAWKKHQHQRTLWLFYGLRKRHATSSSESSKNYERDRSWLPGVSTSPSGTSVANLASSPSSEAFLSQSPTRGSWGNSGGQHHSPISNVLQKLKRHLRLDRHELGGSRSRVGSSPDTSPGRLGAAFLSPSRTHRRTAAMTLFQLNRFRRQSMPTGTKEMAAVGAKNMAPVRSRHDSASSTDSLHENEFYSSLGYSEQVDAFQVAHRITDCPQEQRYVLHEMMTHKVHPSTALNQIDSGEPLDPPLRNIAKELRHFPKAVANASLFRQIARLRRLLKEQKEQKPLPKKPSSQRRKAELMQALFGGNLGEDDESQIYVKFFKFHKCYDLIPTSAKLVVFDTQLLVKKAFFALVYNGVRAAPLWDSKRQQFVGMLTITDFIRILQMYYKHADEKIEELEEHKLDQWRTVLGYNSKPLIFIGPEESLYEAIAILLRNRIHRLPVIDPVSGDVLYIITHKRILRFLHLYISDLPRPSLMSRTLGELRVGSYDQIELARPDTPVIEALTKFVNRRVSALPIVDHDGRLVHIYSKFDVINLAAEKTYNNLDVPLKSAISHRSENKVETCRLTDTFSQVLEKIVRAEVHRLVITDEDHRVIGVISLSDILDALVIRPHEYNIDLDLCDLGGETVGVLEDELGPDQQAGHHVIPEEEPGQEEEPSLATLSLAHRQA